MSAAVERQLLYVASPGTRNYVENGGVGILVFDSDNGYKFVRRIPHLERAEGLSAEVILVHFTFSPVFFLFFVVAFCPVFVLVFFLFVVLTVMISAGDSRRAQNCRFSSRDSLSCSRNSVVFMSAIVGPSRTEASLFLFVCHRIPMKPGDILDEVAYTSLLRCEPVARPEIVLHNGTTQAKRAMLCYEFATRIWPTLIV